MMLGDGKKKKIIIINGWEYKKQFIIKHVSKQGRWDGTQWKMCGDGWWIWRIMIGGRV